MKGGIKSMKYDNMSREELIALLKKPNETIENFEKREQMLMDKIKQLSDSNVAELISDLEKQKKVQSELISQLRNGRAGLLRILGELYTTSVSLKDGDKNVWS